MSEACVVCGAPVAGHTGHVFYADGKIRVGLPFCKKHLGQLGASIADPIFENQQALDFFMKKHPQLYLKHVEGKKIIFLQSTTIRSNHVASGGRPPTKIALKPRNENSISVSPNSFVLTKKGFKKIGELSLNDLVLGVEEPTKGLKWKTLKVGVPEHNIPAVTIITDKNDITLNPRERLRIIRDEKTEIVEAEDVTIDDFLETHLINREFTKTKTSEEIKPTIECDLTNSLKLSLNEEIAYILGVLNNTVTGLSRNLTLKIWGADTEEINQYGKTLYDIICKVNDYIRRSIDIQYSEPTSYHVEEGPRYSWLIFAFSEEMPEYLKILSNYGVSGTVPISLRLADDQLIKEYLAGIIEISLEFDKKLKTFRIPFSTKMNEIRRFVLNYFNFVKVYSIVTEVSSPNNPWEIYTYVDVHEIVEKCGIRLRRPLAGLAYDMGPGEYHGRVTLYPKVKSVISGYDSLIKISFEPLWKPLVEWITIA